MSNLIALFARSDYEWVYVTELILLYHTEGREFCMRSLCRINSRNWISARAWIFLKALAWYPNLGGIKSCFYDPSNWATARCQRTSSFKMCGDCPHTSMLSKWIFHCLPCPVDGIVQVVSRSMSLLFVKRSRGLSTLSGAFCLFCRTGHVKCLGLRNQHLRPTKSFYELSRVFAFLQWVVPNKTNTRTRKSIFLPVLMCISLSPGPPGSCLHTNLNPEHLTPLQEFLRCQTLSALENFGTFIFN